jgi:hypothetical protein
MFAKILSFVAVLASTPALANSVYYLSPQGSDASNGTSPATAWQTIEKVNGFTFGPGDSLLIDSSHGAFSGCLTFSSVHVTSTSANPFVVGAYGGDKWVLNSNCGSDGNASAALTINSVSGIVIQDGVLSGNGSRTLYGVWIMNTLLSGPADSIIIQRMDISDFNTSLTTNSSSEVFITGYPGSGITGVQILDNNLHGLTTVSLDDNGISGYGNGLNIAAIYSGNYIYNIGGMTGRAGGTTGNGIWCDGTSNCEVAYNYIHDIGANVNQCGGPVGIGTYAADNSYVHDNEIHHVHATTWNTATCDFAALDADGKSTNGIWERNYTHHNDGPAFVFGGSPPESPWGPNQFRLNISEEDNLQNTDGGGIWALSPTNGGYVYNNTAYRSLNQNGSVSFCVSFGYSGTYEAGLFANNTCTNGVIIGGYTGALYYANSQNQSSPIIVNNNYFVSGVPVFYWVGSQYLSLVAFQTSTGNDAYSTTVDPVLVAPGDGGDCGGLLAGVCPTAYELGPGSPMVGNGADLAQFAIPLPLTGYYAAPFENIRGYNVGVDSRLPATCATSENNSVRARACATLTATHDFNGDGYSDVAWRDGNGDLAIWLMYGRTVINPAATYVASVPYPLWTIIGMGDFNGDGYADFLWRDSSGDLAIWEMMGTQVLNSNATFVGTVTAPWSVIGNGDFNGDGMSDLLWTDGNGNYAIWEMNGTQVLNPNATFVANVSTVWKIAGTGDFNGDGKSDILWEDQSGDYAIWEMNGTQIINPTATFVATVVAPWSVIRIGDYNGDGMSDLLWTDGNGNYAIWEMNGTQAINPMATFVAFVASPWSVIGTGDYDGDGMSDLLWTDGNGNYAIWEMNGTTLLNPNATYVANVPTSWMVQLPLGE